MFKREIYENKITEISQESNMSIKQIIEMIQKAKNCEIELENVDKENYQIL
jgi:hypothetical protein